MFCLLLNHDTISNISPYVPSVMSKCLLLFSWEEASTYFPSLLRHLFVIRKQKQKKKTIGGHHSSCHDCFRWGVVEQKHMTAYLSEKRQPFLLRRHLNWLGKCARKNLKAPKMPHKTDVDGN